MCAVMCARFGLLLLLVTASTACFAEPSEPEEVAESQGQEIRSREAVETPWGTDLHREALDSRPNPAWPGVYDQPAMTRGPGSCGFTAVANVTAQLLSRPNAGESPISPWDALDRRSYDTWVGLYPSSAIAMLDEIFSDPGVVGEDMQGTTFEWHRDGWGHGLEAWERLTASLAAGKPFIALISYGNEGSWTFSKNHYVTVVGTAANDDVLIAHWGGYERVAKDTFLTWWENHGVYSFAGIYPSRASRLDTTEPRQTRAPAS